MTPLLQGWPNKGKEAVFQCHWGLLLEFIQLSFRIYCDDSLPQKYPPNIYLSIVDFEQVNVSWVTLFLILKVTIKLIHFLMMFQFYTPKNIKKAKCFLMFFRGTEDSKKPSNKAKGRI